MVHSTVTGAYNRIKWIHTILVQCKYDCHSSVHSKINSIHVPSYFEYLPVYQKKYGSYMYKHINKTNMLTVYMLYLGSYTKTDTSAYLVPTCEHNLFHSKEYHNWSLGQH